MINTKGIGQNRSWFPATPEKDVVLCDPKKSIEGAFGFLTHSRLSPGDSRNLRRYGIRNRRLGIGMGSLAISPYVWIRINGKKRVRGGIVRPLSFFDLSAVLHFLAVGDEQLI